ncbi:DUF2530 domain-containing protein [Rhodococcus sp. NPDC058505]|uniref:DUF2530 domain-containing protein n=1 Tax=unclassified Rhodococcus (in: high G+C Gram-positive bacteria) TaxID=192944 RepID=UPI003652B61E
MSTPRNDPLLPARLIDPRPVLALGTAAWMTATILVLLVGDRWEPLLPICLAGLAFGALGSALFLAQRRAARRGSRTAQRGLS